MERHNSGSETKEDLKISNDQKKIKNTMDLIKQAKHSMRKSKCKAVISFA